MGILEQFAGREAGPFIQFVKYAIAGGIATVTHISLFHLLAWKLFPALEADDWAVKLLKLPVSDHEDRIRARHSMYDNMLAFLVSNLVAYLINIYWVFEPGRHSRWVEIGLFYLVSGLSMVIGTSIMGWLIRRYGMLTTFAFGANLVTSLLINYALRRFFIFRG